MTKAKNKSNRLVLGVDTGGTFTDFILQTPSGLQTFKVPSTPDDPSRAIIDGLNHFFGSRLPGNLEIIHGSTVATNAFLERKGARTLLVTTAGFEDVLFIGRQNRPKLYDFNVSRPMEIIPRSQVTGVRERMLYDGTVLRQPGRSVGRRLRNLCKGKKIESVAVCFLHSYANDAHEARIRDALEKTGLPVTLSSDILPEFREYERLTTTLINAYLGPTISSYIKRLQQGIGSVPLNIQLSNGSVLPADEIDRRAVYTILSGPAGGVHGSHQLAGEMGLDRIITFDMGGTSTDVSLCDQRPTLTRDHQVDGYPIRIEVMDIHTVGAGGGSIAHRDSGGLLKVGPESAGASPGPICYGFGGRNITVTDANLYLGRLLPDRFMGGTMKLRTTVLKKAMESFADELGLDPAAAAFGIIRIVNASMAKAIRAVSLEKGHDPKEFALFCYGGASGLHCCELARELSINRVVIPARAGILSAQGMVFAEAKLDSMQTLFLSGNELETTVLADTMDSLVKRSLADAKQTFQLEERANITVDRFLNLRCQGQSYELCIPYTDDFMEHFHRSHAQNFGYRLDEKPLELVSIQCSVRSHRDKIPLPRKSRSKKQYAEPVKETTVRFQTGTTSVPLYDRKSFLPGHMVNGPALVADDYITVLLTEDFTLEVDRLFNLVLEKKADSA